MVQKVYLKIFLTVLFHPNEFSDNFILAKELPEKALQSFGTCVLVNNNLCQKLFSSLELPTTLDEIFILIH